MAALATTTAVATTAMTTASGDGNGNDDGNDGVATAGATTAVATTVINDDRDYEDESDELPTTTAHIAILQRHRRRQLARLLRLRGRV